MKAKRIITVGISILIALSLVFMYPTLSPSTVNLIKNKLDINIQSIAFADGGQNSEKAYDNFTHNTNASSTEDLLKEYEAAVKREKNAQTTKDIEKFYLDNYDQLSILTGGKQMHEYTKEDWDMFAKAKAKSDKIKAEDAKYTMEAISIFGTAATQMIAGLTQSIVGYYNDKGEYVKAIDTDKLTSYVTSNVVPNFLKSSGKLLGQMVGGPAGAAIGGLVTNLFIGIGSFVKAWFAPPPQAQNIIDSNNDLYRALDSQTAKIMNAIDDNTEKMEKHFDKIEYDLTEDSLNNALKSIYSQTDNLYLMGKSYNDKFTDPAMARIEWAISEDLWPYYFSVLPDYYDTAITILEDEINTINTEQVGASSADATACSQEITDKQNLISQYKKRINYCIGYLQNQISIETDEAKKASKQQEFDSIKIHIDYQNKYSGIAGSEEPLLCDVYNQIMEKRNINNMFYNYSELRKANPGLSNNSTLYSEDSKEYENTDLTKYSNSDYSPNAQESQYKKEKSLMNDNDYIALYSIYLYCTSVNDKSKPTQEQLASGDFSNCDIGNLFQAGNYSLNALDSEYATLYSMLNGTTMSVDISKFMMSSNSNENKFFRGAKVNNVYDAYFTLSLIKEQGVNEENDYSTALSNSLSKLRTFHDRNMSALSDSQFLWNIFAVCKNYQKSITKQNGTSSSQAVEDILAKYYTSGTQRDVENLFYTSVNEICSFDEEILNVDDPNYVRNTPYDYFNQNFKEPFKVQATLVTPDKVHTYKEFINAWEEANKNISDGKSVSLTLHTDIHSKDFKYTNDEYENQPIEFTGKYNTAQAATAGATLIFDLNGFDYYYDTTDAIRIAKPQIKGSSESHHNTSDIRGLSITSGRYANGNLKQSQFKPEDPLKIFSMDSDASIVNTDDKPSIAVINANYGGDAHDYNFRRRAVSGPKLEPMGSKNTNVEIWGDKSYIAQSFTFKMEGIEISNAPKSAVCIAGNLNDEFIIDNCKFNENKDGALEFCEFSKINISNTEFKNNVSVSTGNSRWNKVQGGAAVRLKNLNVFETTAGDDLNPFVNFYYANVYDDCPSDDLSKKLKPEMEQIRRNASAMGWQNGTYEGITNTPPRVIFENCLFEGNIAKNGNGGAVWIEEPLYFDAEFAETAQLRYNTNSQIDKYTKAGLEEGVHYTDRGMTGGIYHTYNFNLSYMTTCFMEDFFTFKNCTFINNQSEEGNGGCIAFCNYIFTCIWPSLTLDCCTFENNSAKNYGPVLSIEPSHSADHYHVKHSADTWGNGEANAWVWNKWKPDKGETIAFQRTKIRFDGDNYSQYWKNNNSATASPNAQVECDGRVDIFTTHQSQDSYNSISQDLGSWITSDLLGDTKGDGGRRGYKNYWTGAADDDYHERSENPISHWYYSCADEVGTDVDNNEQSASDAGSKYSGTYHIVLGKNQNKMFDVKGAKTDNNTIVQLYDPTGSNCQKYTFIYNANDDTYLIKDVKSGKYLDVHHDSCENGQDIQIYESTGTSYQKWKIDELENGRVCIKSAANSNYKMAAKDAQENGAIVLYDDAHSKNDFDKFILKQVWETSYEFTAGATDSRLDSSARFAGKDYQLSFKMDKNQVVSVKGDSLADGAHLEMRHNTNAASQWWHFECDSDGLFTITNKNSGKYLSIVDDAVGNAKYIVQKSTCDTMYQKWKIVLDNNKSCVKFVSAADESYEICVFNYHSEDGAEVRLYIATGDQWRGFKLANGEYKLAKKLY